MRQGEIQSCIASLACALTFAQGCYDSAKDTSPPGEQHGVVASDQESDVPDPPPTTDEDRCAEAEQSMQKVIARIQKAAAIDELIVDEAVLIIHPLDPSVGPNNCARIVAERTLRTHTELLLEPIQSICSRDTEGMKDLEKKEAFDAEGDLARAALEVMGLPVETCGYEPDEDYFDPVGGY